MTFLTDKEIEGVQKDVSETIAQLRKSLDDSFSEFDKALKAALSGENRKDDRSIDFGEKGYQPQQTSQPQEQNPPTVNTIESPPLKERP